MKHVRERLGKHCGLVRLERCKTKLMLVCRGFLAKKRVCFTSGFLLRNVFCNSVSEGYRYRFFFFRIDSPQNTGTADTDSKILCAEYPELSVVLSCKPAVSRDIALRAPPAAWNSALLVFAFPFHSTSFSRMLFKHKVTCVVYSAADFYLRYGQLSAISKQREITALDRQGTHQQRAD